MDNNNNGNNVQLQHQNASNLPPEVLEQIVGRLSMLDRLNCNGVNRHWRNALKFTMWTTVRKLDREIVFERTPGRRVWRFDGNQLTALFRCIGRNLRELDLYSFRPRPYSHRAGKDQLRPFIPQIAESVQLLEGLETLDLRSFDLALFVDFLPPTLRSLRVSEWFSTETAETLSEKCPLLEEFSFDYIRYINSGRRIRRPRRTAPTASDLSLEAHRHDKLDSPTIRVMATRCVHIQRLSLTGRVLAEGTSFLALMPSLTELEITFDSSFGSLRFTERLLRAIARRGQLKKFVLETSSELTDDAVDYLIEHCKALSTLVLIRSVNLTERSLRAVLDEVHRRHGNPPRELPRGPLDPGIFYFPIGRELVDPNDVDPRDSLNMVRRFGSFLKIREGPVRDEAAGNPWLTTQYRYSLQQRKFC